MTTASVKSDAAATPKPAADTDDEKEPKPDPEEKELLCTICGLRACWQK